MKAALTELMLPEAPRMKTIRIMLMLLLLAGGGSTREQLTFQLGPMGNITGVTTNTKIYPDAPFSNKTYYKFRNLPYAGPVDGAKRFTQPVLRTEPYSPVDGTPWDATRDGPLCAQGGLEKEALDALKNQTLYSLMDTVLNGTFGEYPDNVFYIDILLSSIETILDVPKGTLNIGKTVEQVLHDWLDMDVDVAEDCLQLSVSTPWRPDGTENATYPVMFFVYGGAFYAGTQVKMGPERLGAWGDVVLVTINYRLGPLGFMCLDTDEAAGNMGMLDMVVALEWVHKYIAYFGGDKTQITVFGESAGSASIGHLLLSNATNGLFARGIGQSGSALATWAFDTNPAYHAKNIAAKLDCYNETHDDLVDCLRTKDVNEITGAFKEYSDERRKGGYLGFGGTIPCAQSAGARKFYDIGQSPESIMMSGDYEKVPIMFGANKHEGSYVYGVVYNQYLVPNNLTENVEFLKYELIPQLLKTVGVTNSYALERLVEESYFEPWQIDGKLHDMRHGIIDLLSVFFLKASSYEMVKENSRFEDSYWYAFNYESVQKSFFNILFLNPEKKANISRPGVCHADELIYLFDVDLPLVLCDIEDIAMDALACAEGLNLTNIDINIVVDAISCLTEETGPFRSKWGDCLTGRLNQEELGVSGILADMWTNFASSGNPGYNMRPWNREDMWYLRIDTNTTIEQDYELEYHIRNHEASTSSAAPSSTTATTSSTTPGGSTTGSTITSISVTSTTTGNGGIKLNPSTIDTLCVLAILMNCLIK